MKEKTSTIVWGVILSIIMGITLTVGYLLFMVGQILNIDSLKKAILSDRVFDSVYEMIEDRWNEDDMYGSIGYEVDFEDVMTEEFVKRMVGDAFDAFKTGDDEIFEDEYYEDYIEDVMLPAFVESVEDEYGYTPSRQEQREFVDEIYDSLKDTGSDIAGGLDEDSGDGVSVSDLINIFRILRIAGIVHMIVAAALAVTVILIYRNKYRGLRTVSIAGFIAGVITSLGSLGIKSLISEVLRESIDMSNKLVNSLAEQFLKNELYIALIATVLFLVLIIISGVKIRNMKDEDEQYGV